MKNIRRYGMLIAFALNYGCIQVHPLPPNPMEGITPPRATPNPAQVQSCESTRTAHNTWMLLGVIFGGLAGSGGAVDAATTNHSAQVGVGIGVAASGILAATATTITSIEAETYSVNDCSVILSEAASPSGP